MRINQVMHYMKQMPARIGSHIYSSTQDMSNPQQYSFLKQLQKDLSLEEHLDQSLEELKVVVFDLETTGFHPSHGDKILSIGAVKVHGENVYEDDDFYSFVHSKATLSPQIKQLTGIHEQDIMSAPAEKDVLIDFFQYIKKHSLVAHHFQHEKVFMQNATLNSLGTPFKHRIMDTTYLMQIVNPDYVHFRLEDCCSACGIEVKGRHHALSDAKMTAYLWQYYLKKLLNLGYETLGDVYEKLARMPK